MECKHIPWQDMFLYAVQVCRLSPKDFWEMTMKEFLYLIPTSFSNDAVINKEDLEYMIKNFK